MKNAKNSFISICLISILILLPITATAQPQVLFSDDFEQYEVGKIIDESKWSMDDGIRWTPEAALDPTDESQTNQILKIYRDTIQTGNQAIAMDLGAQTDLVEISYRFYAPTDIENYNQAGNKASYFIINNSENKNIFYLGMDYGIGSNKRVRISGNGTELYPYLLYESANDTWHDIKVLMNPADQSYTFFLDNVMQESYPFRGMATLNNFDVSSVRFYPDTMIKKQKNQTITRHQRTAEPISNI